MTSKHRCQVSGCRRNAYYAFNATIMSLKMCWYACAYHSAQHERDLGHTVPLERKRKPGAK